ncbi:MAG TPA: hypothetical protein VFV57_06640 [Limnobacter sp.]|nr:hypothetical protein [Limnobacter sp.]
MSLQTILLTVTPEAAPEAGVLVDVVHATSLRVFEQSNPYDGVNSLKLVASEFSGARSIASSDIQLGELRCVAQACISDVSLLSGDVSLAHVDPALLADPTMSGLMDVMQNSVEVQDLGVDILQQMPALQQGLHGQLSLAELNTLISQVQAQLLNINAFSQAHYGDLTADVEAAMAHIQHSLSDELITSVQVDTSMLMQPHLAGFDHSLPLDATLDGLFTSPESFPLTLDFSSPSSVQEASELFASAGGSSISSTASSADSGDSGFASSSDNGSHNLG